MCCGKSADEVGPISWNGNCLDCAKALLEENELQISQKHGYAYKRQVRGMLRYAESVLGGELRQAG